MITLAEVKRQEKEELKKLNKQFPTITNTHCYTCEFYTSNFFWQILPKNTFCHFTPEVIIKDINSLKCQHYKASSQYAWSYEDYRNAKQRIKLNTARKTIKIYQEKLKKKKT